MTTHLQLTHGSLVLDSFTPDDSECIKIDWERLDDFDYALNRLTEIVEDAAYQWDGPQTMRLIYSIAKQHLASHGQTPDFTGLDADLIREAVTR
jgi:hypothetical protein